MCLNRSSSYRALCPLCSPLCPCYFLKKNPKPQRGLSSDVAALKIQLSNQGLQIVKSICFGAHRGQRKKFISPFALWSSHALNCFCFPVSAIDYTITGDVLQWCGGQRYSSIWNPLVIIWIESSPLEGYIFFPLSSTAVQRKKCITVSGSQKVCEWRSGRSFSLASMNCPFSLVEASVLKPVRSKSEWNHPLAPWFIIIGHWLIRHSCYLVSFYPHGFSVFFVFFCFVLFFCVVFF